ncbi:hypothetical protein DRP05_07090 [Archaeoglobales archaeon]|nr:MAG: hypothetical protein DRP05_07090 [Archaeoglobales archaeon]
MQETNNVEDSNFSLVFWRMATNKKKRVRKTVYIEEDLLNVLGDCCLSDVLNYVLEDYLKRLGLLNNSKIVELFSD